jgi:RNA polymerase sigma-70 factor (ECF subfamily)
MPGITDEELMMRFQAGDAVAYEMLCERYRTPVFGFIYRMLGNDRGPAEDLLQDIFVKIAGAARLYEPRAKFSTWLFTIVRNHCCNYLKSRHFLQAANTVSIDATGVDGDEAAPSREVAAAADTVREVENRETGAILEAAIQRLPDMYREAFLLRAVQGVSHEDAARILGQKLATVRTHYHRAREMLRADVGPLLGERPVGSAEDQCQ